LINSTLVSICIPTYNSALYLSQTLDSIAAQTYKNIEVIISDNASTDETPDIIQLYCDRYGWTVYRNEVNIGAGNNFNKLIELAHGEHIAIYHADDIYSPTIVEESIKIFQQYPEIGYVGTEANIINEKGIIVGEFIRPQKFINTHKIIMNFDDVFEGIIRHIMLVTPSIMVKKEMYKQYGYFLIDSKYGAACDYELWLRFASQKNIAILNQKLISYRIHSQQGSELELRKNVKIPDIVAVYEEYMSKLTNQDIYKKARYHSQKLILAAAFKQNILGLFVKSNETLKKSNLYPYFVPKIFLYMLNYFKFPIQLIPLIGSKIRHKIKF